MAQRVPRGHRLFVLTLIFGHESPVGWLARLRQANSLAHVFLSEVQSHWCEYDGLKSVVEIGDIFLP